MLVSGFGEYVLTKNLCYSFDQARLIRQNQILARNNVDPSGMLVSLPNEMITAYRAIHASRNANGFKGSYALMNPSFTLSYIHLGVHSI